MPILARGQSTAVSPSHTLKQRGQPHQSVISVAWRQQLRAGFDCKLNCSMIRASKEVNLARFRDAALN